MAPSIDDIKDEIKKNTSSSNSKLNEQMGGNGSCEKVTPQILDTLKKVQSTADSINNTLFSPELNNAATDLNKQLAYQSAKNIAANAQLNYDIAQQDYIKSKPNGSSEYQALLNNRYEQTGINELNELNNKFTDTTNLINSIIVVVGEQDIAEKNMKILLKKLEVENQKLNDIINGENTQARTYNRKSVYESK